MHRLLVITGMLLGAHAAAIPLAAQEIKPVAVYTVSNQPSLQHSGGGGFFLSLDLPHGLRIGGGMVQMRSDSERNGLACRLLNPIPVDCLPERIEEQVTWRSFRLALLPSLNLYPNLRANTGAGVSLNTLSSQSSGETPGRVGNLFLPRTAHIGAFLRMDLSWWPVARFPLGLSVGGGSHWVAFDGCVANSAFYAPFCGASRLTELQAGLTYRLPVPR